MQVATKPMKAGPACEVIREMRIQTTNPLHTHLYKYIHSRILVIAFNWKLPKSLPSDEWCCVGLCSFTAMLRVECPGPRLGHFPLW